MSTCQNKNRTEHFCRALPVKFLFMITIVSSPHLYGTLSTLPWILTFLCIWQELSVKLDDNSVVAICILCHIHIKSKINGTNDCVAALLMDDVLDRRAVCIYDLMESVERFSRSDVLPRLDVSFTAPDPEDVIGPDGKVSL